jgi:xylulokinase
MACLIGLDLGTTSTDGILIRPPASVLATASRPVELHSARPGWAEEDPEQWWSNACLVIRGLIASAGIAPGDVSGLGVAGMLPAVVLLDRQGRLLRPSIQQSDGRCADFVRELREEVAEADFLARTGNGINQQLVAPKLRWIERHEPDVFRRIATVFGSYDYLNWRLTGERTVERNWALEAGFMDIRSGEMGDDLVALAHLSRSALPRVVAAHQILGTVTPEASAETGLPAGIPVAGGAADFIASALAAGIHRPGDVLCKFGGAIDVLTVSTAINPDPRIFTDYHLIPDLYVPNGCMATGGSALNWFAETFAAGRPLAELDALAQAVPAGADGLAVLPYFLGEKTPVHDPEARGLFAGLSLSHGVGHLWRALLEAYAYAIAHHVEVFGTVGLTAERFTASDGGAASAVWMQIVADVLQRPLRRLAGHPGSCLGAAWAAAMATGAARAWSGATGFVKDRDRIEPNPRQADAYRRGYEIYRALYRKPSDDPPR